MDEGSEYLSSCLGIQRRINQNHGNSGSGAPTATILGDRQRESASQARQPSPLGVDFGTLRCQRQPEEEIVAQPVKGDYRARRASVTVGMTARTPTSAATQGGPKGSACSRHPCVAQGGHSTAKRLTGQCTQIVEADDRLDGHAVFRAEGQLRDEVPTRAGQGGHHEMAYPVGDGIAGEDQNGPISTTGDGSEPDLTPSHRARPATPPGPTSPPPGPTPRPRPAPVPRR